MIRFEIEDHQTNPLAVSTDLDLEPVKSALSVYEGQITAMEREAQALVVDNDGKMQIAVKIGTTAKGAYNALEKKRKVILEPAAAYTKNVNNLFKAFQGRFTEVEAMLKGKISNYQRAQALARAQTEEAARKAQAEAQAKLNAEIAAENERRAQEAKATGQDIPVVQPVELAPVVAPVAPKVVRTEAGSAHQRKTWVFEVVDYDQVPREYLVVDESAIRRAVRDGIRKIPGVRIFEQTDTVFKA